MQRCQLLLEYSVMTYPIQEGLDGSSFHVAFSSEETSELPKRLYQKDHGFGSSKK